MNGLSNPKYLPHNWATKLCLYGLKLSHFHPYLDRWVLYHHCEYAFLLLSDILQVLTHVWFGVDYWVYSPSQGRRTTVSTSYCNLLHIKVASFLPYNIPQVLSTVGGVHHFWGDDILTQLPWMGKLEIVTLFLTKPFLRFRLSPKVNLNQFDKHKAYIRK